MSIPSGADVENVGGRVRFHYNASETRVTNDGYMHVKKAHAVFAEVLEEWGVSDTADRSTNLILGKIAHALRQGTSAERDFSKVSFDHLGREFDLDVLRLAASKKDGSENPVRVWARSYNDGEIAVRIHDMLKDPANVQLREEAALDYECTLDVVHVSFDFADALVKFDDMRLSQLERVVIKTNTRNKVRSSRSAYLGGTDGGSVQDSAANAAAVETAKVPTSGGSAISNGNSRARAGFAPMR